MANLYNKAGLVNIPIGYSDGFLYNIKPVDDTLAFRFNRDSAATRVNKEGLIEQVGYGDKPRIDYTDSLTSPSFLLEPQRTNLITFSEDFGDSDWTKANVNINTNTALAPDGNTTADKLIADTSNNKHYVQDVASSLTGVYRASVFAKAYGYDYIEIGERATGGARAVFNLSTGEIETQVLSPNAKMEYYGNGWYRCSIEETMSASTFAFRISVSDNATSDSSWIGNGTDGILIWGAQLEEGSYATSYIPTAGSTVTRAQETCNGAGSASTFNSTEGVLYAEIAALTDVDGDASLRFISLSNGTSSKRITIYYFSSETFGVQLKNNGYEVTDLYIGGSVDRRQFNKIALYYSGSNVKAYLNGIEVFTNSSWIPFPDNTINTLTFTGGSLYDLPFYGKTKGVYVFNEALTDDELQQLTGPEYNSFAALAAAYNYTVI